MMTIDAAMDGIFDPILTRMMDSSFSLAHHLMLHLYWKKLEKDFQKILNTLRCDMVASFKQYNDVTDRHAASVRLYVFLFSPRAGTGV